MTKNQPQVLHKGYAVSSSFLNDAHDSIFA